MERQNYEKKIILFFLRKFNEIITILVYNISSEGFMNLEEQEKKDLLEFIGDYLNIDLTCKKVGELKWKLARYSETNIPYNKKYDKLSLIEFFTLYKMSRLASMNIIDKKTEKKLEDLLYLKKDLGRKIGLLCDDEDNRNIVNELLNVSNKIDKIFKKYHLLINELSLDKIIDNIIINENYNVLIEEQSLRNDDLYEKEDNNIDETIHYLNKIIEEKGKVR